MHFACYLCFTWWWIILSKTRSIWVNTLLCLDWLYNVVFIFSNTMGWNPLKWHKFVCVCGWGRVWHVVFANTDKSAHIFCALWKWLQDLIFFDLRENSYWMPVIRYCSDFTIIIGWVGSWLSVPLEVANMWDEILSVFQQFT